MQHEAEVDQQKKEGWWHDRREKPSVILKHKNAEDFLDLGTFAEALTKWIESNVSVALSILNKAYERLPQGT
jgi:hypothetical protein